ncbi:hypothetical protein C8J56DRAFT_890576 [Mycena floridula]|nr:hypothetical protein C8J56DRAFT_890576 [Mycena floridula]
MPHTVSPSGSVALHSAPRCESKEGAGLVGRGAGIFGMLLSEVCRASGAGGYLRVVRSLYYNEESRSAVSCKSQSHKFNSLNQTQMGVPAFSLHRLFNGINQSFTAFTASGKIGAVKPRNIKVSEYNRSPGLSMQAGCLFSPIMPSFSLVRHFGKQRKAIVDSPVSSGLVEQHVSPTMAESLHSQIGQPSEAGNVFSGKVANSSHGLTAGLVALSQRMEGVSIRDIKGPVMSNNQFAVLRAGDIYLEEEIERYLDENNVWRTRYKGQITASSARNMSIWSFHGKRADEELEKAYQVYASLPRHGRHPNILQLYGICHSPHLTALVFHGAPHLMDLKEYFKTLPSSQLNIYLSKLHSGSNMRGSKDNSAFDPRICTAFETNTFIKEDLLDYYNFLFAMVDMPFYHTTLHIPHDSLSPFQLFHPEINLPVYSLPGGNRVVHEMDITVQETGIVLTLLPNMTIRQFNQDDVALFATWACQGNYVIHDLSINIMDLQTDEEGQHIVDNSLMQASFGITVDWYWDIGVYHVPPQLYEILHTIHKGCGFDPYSTQVAEYLGLPLVVTDGGHSGLEECMEDPEESELGDSDHVLRDFNSDVEDSEYDSKSESGDSDYMSASEDVIWATLGARNGRFTGGGLATETGGWYGSGMGSCGVHKCCTIPMVHARLTATARGGPGLLGGGAESSACLLPRYAEISDTEMLQAVRAALTMARSVGGVGESRPMPKCQIKSFLVEKVPDDASEHCQQMKKSWSQIYGGFWKPGETPVDEVMVEQAQCPLEHLLLHSALEEAPQLMELNDVVKNSDHDITVCGG